jgi:DNA sulfur modification protein DndD
MIINYISISNFQCFYGPFESNTISFSDGINVIIGDNGHGKSKLWNTFYWALYDQIFDSDKRRFVTTRQGGENIISDRAKKECAIDDFIKAGIKLEVQDSRGIRYEIYRTLKAKKLDDRKWDMSENSILLIREYKVTKWQQVNESDYQNILNRVLPGHLKPYMWFQGEQVDSLMDFQDQTSLTQAIKLLSNINDYDELINITKQGSVKAEKAYNAELKRLSSSTKISEEIEVNENNLKESLKSELQELEDNKRNKENAQIGFDDLVNGIDAAKERIKNKGRLDACDSELASNKKQLDLKVGALNKKLFSSHWVLKDSQPSLDAFAEKYDQFLEDHHQKAALDRIAENQLPVDVPQPIFVNKMLDAGTCFICGHLAPEGSDEYKHIEGLLGRETQSDSTLKNDCASFYKKLYNSMIEQKNVIARIKESITSEFDEMANLQNAIANNKSELATINESFQGLVEKDGSDGTVREFQMHQSNIEKYTDAININNRYIEEFQEELADIQKKKTKLVVGSTNKLLKTTEEIYKHLCELAVSTRSLVFTNLIKLLEESANEIFQNMAERNQAVTGRLRLRVLDSKTCIPEIVDGDGYRLTGSNDSNIVLVKLALMMAVLKSREKWSQNYCLVSDAPTAKMAFNYSGGFYEALGKNFRQSIVITYDFLSINKKSDIEVNNLGNVYKLNAVIPAGDRTTRDDLYTEIKEMTE